MEYAIVDIETTGGHASAHGITEIAVFVHDGQKTSLVFESLINPEVPIPLHIVALTGINDEMVKNAPVFGEIAEQLYRLLEGRVFVAHNVNFDYSFIKHHFELHGYQWNVPKLCTVRLSRKFFPGMSSYSLGRLCQQLDIGLHHRHRAGGDAEATASLFSMMLENDRQQWIPEMLKRNSKEQVLPPHLYQNDFDILPHATGVYYFKNGKGKVIYVGKAKDIRKRVISHFSGQNPHAQRQHFLRDIHRIDFALTGTELMALLLEATEIKRLWPENNRALKKFEPKFALYQYEDQTGYKRLAIDKHQKFQSPVHTFGSLNEGYLFLNRLIKTYTLCPKLCAVQKIKGACLHYSQAQCQGACIGQESHNVYNKRLEQALEELSLHLPSFVILDKGRQADEQSCIWVEKGKLYGMGYLHNESDLTCLADIKTNLTPYASNTYMTHLIMDYAAKNPDKVRKIALED